MYAKIITKKHVKVKLLHRAILFLNKQRCKDLYHLLKFSSQTDEVI